MGSCRILAASIATCVAIAGCSKDSQHQPPAATTASAVPSAEPAAEPLPSASAAPVASAPAPVPSIIPQASTQAIVVTTTSWKEFSGVLQRWERDPSGPWHKVGDELAVAIGRRGMAWGRGLHPEVSSGPSKKEGDFRSPAGLFDLAGAYGYNESAPEGARWPYSRLTVGWRCIDDPRNERYNTMLLPEGPHAPAPTVAWDGVPRNIVFDRFVLVKHNVEPVVRGAGSCVLLHPWVNAATPTQGCTGMATASLQLVLAWIDPSRRPVLLQLPRDVLREHAPRWGLPI